MRHWQGPLGRLLLLGLLGVIYFLFDPSQSAWMPQCPFLQLTGWQCPTCGAQRATHALLQGELGKAARHNWLLVLLAPYLLGWMLVALLPSCHLRKQLHRWLTHRYALLSLLALLLFWLVLRNALGL